MTLAWSSRSIMAILSGNLFSKTATQLQNQVFLIPWVKKEMKMGTIRCSKGRDYSNSVPVRYIPNKSLGNKESEASSSLPKSRSDDTKKHESLVSNGKRAEFSRDGQNSCSSKSLVVDNKFQKQRENPIKKVNYNVDYATSGVTQSNVKRIQFSQNSPTSCVSRTSVVDNEFRSGNEKPVSNVNNVVGSGTGSVQANVGGIELSKSAQASCSSRSFVLDTEFENQSEKPMSQKNNDIGWGTHGVLQRSVEIIKPSKSAETSCSSRRIVVGPQFQNPDEKPFKDVKYDVESVTSSNVKSDLPSIELSESTQNSCGDRSFVVETECYNQNTKPINNMKYDVGLGTSRVGQSNEHSNNEQTSCSRRTFILNTEGVEEFDGDMHFDNYEFMEELEGLSKEESDEGHGIQGVKIKKDVEKLAVELLAVRAFTAAELRKKLMGKNFPLYIVDGVVTDFQARGLINDGLYAETFSRSRWSSSTWGPRRIKKALYSKGVSDVDAEKALELVFNDASISGDQESGVGMSKLSMNHLIAQASKQWLRSCDVSREKRKARIIRWLQYRGFSWSIICFVLKKLESESPA